MSRLLVVASLLVTLGACVRHTCGPDPSDLEFGDLLAGTSLTLATEIGCSSEATVSTVAPGAPFSVGRSPRTDGPGVVLEVTFSPATMGTWDVPLEVSVEGSNIEPDTFFVDLTGMAHAAEVPTEPVDVGIHVVTPSGPLADVSGSASNPGCLPGSSDGTGACEVGNVAPDANLVVDGRFVGTGHGWLTLPPNAWIPPWTQGTLEISLPDDAIVEAAPVSTSVGTLTFEAPAGTILRFGELVPLVSADAWLAGLGIDPTRVVWSAHIDAGLLPRDVVVTSDTAFPAKGVMSLVRSQDGAVLPLAITGGTSFTVPEAGIVVLTD